jgi:hypothetical protein
MCEMNPSANCSGLIVSEQGKKCAILLSQSTITHNELYPSTNGNPTIKSIDIKSHGLSGTCIGLNNPNGACLTGLILLQVLQ